MPEPRDQDNWEEDRERFAHQMSEWLSDPLVELWFSDESGIEGDPRPRKCGAIKGSKPTITYAGSHLRRNLVGPVRPSVTGNSSPSCLGMIFEPVLWLKLSDLLWVVFHIG